MNSHHRRRRTNRFLRRSGLSLLEVILAIAILGGSIVIIGELVRLGSRNAESARESTMAQILCETKMSEIAAGIIPAESQTKVPVDGFPDWLYSIETEQLSQDSFLAVRIKVEMDQPTRQRPISFTLTRWMVDPAIELQPPPSESSGSEQSSSSSSNSSSSSSKSSTGKSGTGAR